jgi:hypothetical protein
MNKLPKKYRNTLQAIGTYQLLGGGLGFISLIVAMATSDGFSQPHLITPSIGLVLFVFTSICGAQLLFFNSNLLLTKINQWLQVFGIWAGPFAFKYAGGINLSFRIFFDDMTVKVMTEVTSITFSYFGEHVGFSVDFTALFVLHTVTKLSDGIKEYKLLRDYSD